MLALQKKNMAVSLLEILIAFTILIVAVLTMVGYTVMIHRTSVDAKRQAIASTEARAALELIRDSASDFEQAASSSGFSRVETEYLLDTEVDPALNEQGTKSAAQFVVEGRAHHLSGDIYGLTVRVEWEEDGRDRHVVIESRGVRPGR